MKTIYLDEDFCCHVTNPDCTLMAIETDEFDNFCDSYIECHRYIPSGESWTSPDGSVFVGEMISPYRDCSEAEEEQRDYERQLIAEYETLIDELYSEVTAE